MNNLPTIEESIAALEHEIANFDKPKHVFRSDFDSHLDENHRMVSIGDMQFRPSEVLKNCDPIAYNEAFANYVDSLDLSDIEAYCELTDELAELQAELED